MGWWSAQGCATADDNVGTGGLGGFGTGGSAAGGSAGSGNFGNAGGFGNVAGSGNAGGTGNVGGTGNAGGSGNVGGVGASGGTGGGTCTPPVAGGTCDTVPQCGCQPGQACTVTSTTGTTGCITAGTQGPFTACTANGACQAGYACIGGACKPLCETQADCKLSPNAKCRQVMYDNAGTSTPIPKMLFCSAACALENPASCGTGLACLEDGQNPAGTDCATSTGTATGKGGCQKSPNPDPRLCAPGYACLTNGDCAKWCRVGKTGDCSSGTCAGFAAPNQLFVYGQEYGVCQ